MESLRKLKLKPTMTPEGFADEFEAGRNCKSIQYEGGAYYVFRPVTHNNQTYAHDLLITAHGWGQLQWSHECPKCSEMLPGAKQLASHMWHRHQVKMKETK